MTWERPESVSAPSSHAGCVDKGQTSPVLQDKLSLSLCKEPVRRIGWQRRKISLHYGPNRSLADREGGAINPKSRRILWRLHCHRVYVHCWTGSCPSPRRPIQGHCHNARAFGAAGESAPVASGPGPRQTGSAPPRGPLPERLGRDANRQSAAAANRAAAFQKGRPARGAQNPSRQAGNHRPYSANASRRSRACGDRSS